MSFELTRRPMDDDQSQLWLDARTHSVGVGDRSTRLTGPGFSMLELLHRRRGEMVTFDELARAAGTRSAAAGESALHTAIYRVRHALEELGSPGLITSVRGFGYILAAGVGPALSPRDLSGALRALGTPVVIASRGQVVLANDAAARLLGRAIDELEGGTVPGEPAPSRRATLGSGLELLEYASA